MGTKVTAQSANLASSKASGLASSLQYGPSTTRFQVSDPTAGSADELAPFPLLPLPPLLLLITLLSVVVGGIAVESRLDRCSDSNGLRCRNLGTRDQETEKHKSRYEIDNPIFTPNPRSSQRSGV